ncbi:MAG: sugar transferase, partial [Eubacteriaceae bacterium]
IGLVLLSPLYIILALMIYIDDPDGSPLFWQERVGKDGRIFKFYKFRTMYIDAEDELENLLDKNEMQGPPFKMQNDPRITRFGNKLRATSLDELPQLWNVLKGDMSIVGPRPPLPREAAQYSDHEKTRLSIKPGLTCYWQTCSKRNSVSFDEWVNLDIQYINDRCLRVDLMLIFKTLLVIFSKEGE